MDDQYPVCKSDRYLSPELRLLASPCYHNMSISRGLLCNLAPKQGCCRRESCIGRPFTLGPAPCPICGKILRKLVFISQTSEDLTVEKEVAVRRRIAKEYLSSR